MEATELLCQARAALTKILTGVPLGGERVWPGLQNDLFMAHLSIYRFFARFCSDRRVLDAGCGLGYGSRLLAAAGSQEVCGIDIDPRAIKFAKRNYEGGSLTFEAADCEELELPGESLDLIVSSNTLEHLRKPALFLTQAKSALRPEGALLIAVPPITSESLRMDNEENPHHLSNLTIDEWLELFGSLGLATKIYRHGHPHWRSLDFSSFKRSQFCETTFLFEETDLDGLADEGTLTAVFRLLPRVS